MVYSVHTVMRQSSAKVSNSNDSIAGFKVYCSLCLWLLHMFIVEPDGIFQFIRKMSIFFLYSIQQSMGCTKLWLRRAELMNLVIKLHWLQWKIHFFQHQNCGTCTQFNLCNITHKFSHVYSAMILKREVCNQMMSNSCRHNLLRCTRHSYQTFHACSPLLLLHWQ